MFLSLIGTELLHQTPPAFRWRPAAFTLQVRHGVFIKTDGFLRLFSLCSIHVLIIESTGILFQVSGSFSHDTPRALIRWWTFWWASPMQQSPVFLGYFRHNMPRFWWLPALVGIVVVENSVRYSTFLQGQLVLAHLARTKVGLGRSGWGLGPRVCTLVPSLNRAFIFKLHSLLERGWRSTVTHTLWPFQAFRSFSFFDTLLGLHSLQFSWWLPPRWYKPCFWLSRLWRGTLTLSSFHWQWKLHLDNKFLHQCLPPWIIFILKNWAWTYSCSLNFLWLLWPSCFVVLGLAWGSGSLFLWWSFGGSCLAQSCQTTYRKVKVQGALLDVVLVKVSLQFCSRTEFLPFRAADQNNTTSKTQNNYN